MIEKKVYLVKFDKGYYAKKQPNYHWSFTDDPYLATHYKTRKMAEERGVWGTNLGTLPSGSEFSFESQAYGSTYTIEEYTVKTQLELIDSQTKTNKWNENDRT